MNKDWKNNQILGAVCIGVVGLILAIWPNGSLELVCRIIGIGLLIFGIADILQSISGSRAAGSIVAGTLAVVFGIVFVARPGLIASLIPFIVGLVMVVNAVYNLIQVFRFGTRRGAGIAGSVIMLIFGVLILRNPFTTAGLIVRVMGIAMVLSAIDNVLMALRKD